MSKNVKNGRSRVQRQQQEQQGPRLGVPPGPKKRHVVRHKECIKYKAPSSLTCTRVSPYVPPSGLEPWVDTTTTSSSSSSIASSSSRSAPKAEDPVQLALAALEKQTPIVVVQREEGTTTTHEDDTKEDECIICLEEFSTMPLARIHKCRHDFHRECIIRCLQEDRKCPVCRTQIGAPRGACPSGTMEIHPKGQICPGFGPSVRTIEIIYTIPSGFQASYHEHPGVRYQSTTRVAYLPNNGPGRCLLERLKFAWRHGLIFRVGTSLTTGAENVVVWTSIHHKTSLSGGTHGFPDDKYIDNCNESLDALNVPTKTEADVAPTVCVEMIPYRAPKSLNKNLDVSKLLQAIVISPEEQPTNLNSTAKDDESDDDVVVEATVNGTHVLPPETESPPPAYAPSPTAPPAGLPDPPSSPCSLCGIPLKDSPSVQTKECQHAFHHECLDKFIQSNGSNSCPDCQIPIAGGYEPQGSGPSGTLTIRTNPQPCPGFFDTTTRSNSNAAPLTTVATTIELCYDIPNGTQQSYHENPGVPYTGANRVAYLPNNQEGRELLTRMKYAWSHGFCFSVGTSLTTGQSNVVTWSPHVPHKTILDTGSRARSPFGYPDPNYIASCNAALDQLGIPSADLCPP